MNYSVQIFILILSFLCGAIPFSFIIGKLFYKVDLRIIGSGNPGATNLFRIAGAKAGIFGFILDVLRGIFPVFLMKHFIGGEIFPILSGVFAFLGNIFSPFLRFKGGKGVTTILGSFIALSPIGVIIPLFTWALVFLFFRYVSLASVSAALMLPLGILFEGFFKHKISNWLLATGVGAGIIIVLRHLPNIFRLTKGTEKKIVWKA